MKKYGLEAIVHLIFWASTTWLITSGFSIEAQEIDLVDGVETIKVYRNSGWVVQLSACVMIAFIAFYANAWYIIKANKQKSKQQLPLGSGVVFIVLIGLVYGLTEFQLLDNSPPIPKEIAFGVAVFYFAISLTYGLIKISIFNARQQQQLLLDKKQAELALLRNQLQPHFLFNALNNLLSMVNPKDNPRLIDSFERLSQLLRFVIEGNKADKISVSQEISFLNNYIELQMLRFTDDEVDIDFSVTGEHTMQQVESGLFIPFVENAFKYGAEPEKSSKIELAFDLSEANVIQFKIKNEALLQNPNGSGTGIDVTRQRLELIYPGQHQLSISQENDFIVDLTIYTT